MGEIPVQVPTAPEHESSDSEKNTDHGTQD